jgi:hypothetical protein
MVFDQVNKDIFKKYFPPEKELPADKNIFELGIVLGGTVSSGAYTAGVLDFLIEALDNWESMKKNIGIPDWQLAIKAISGTSGGGVLAATMGKALSYKFPPVRSQQVNEFTDNPFYHVWVDKLDIRALLSTSDLENSSSTDKLKHFLNPESINAAANYVAQFHGKPILQPRSYVPQPLPVFLTLTNLTGVPYKVDWGNNLSQSYVNHADYVRLAIFTGATNGVLRPDEFGVAHNCYENGFIDWNLVTKYALGTSAFPFAFPYQELSRPITHYTYRPLIDPVEGVSQPNIDLHALNNASSKVFDGQIYSFSCADGGVFDNEPIELCRRELAGLLGRNNRKEDARRAVLLIDPFADVAKMGASTFEGLFDYSKTLVDCLITQGRYDTQDIALAARPDCFSRFMITAKRGNKSGGEAIATASVCAFGGFLHKSFREHDYFLGRKNCQEFLNNVDSGLWFHDTNPVFQEWIEKNQIAANQLKRKDSKGVSRLPLIPLYGSSSLEQISIPYPVGIFDVESSSFQEQLEMRIDKIFDKISDELPLSFLGKIGIKFWGEISGKDTLRKNITQAIKKDLNKWEL